VVLVSVFATYFLGIKNFDLPYDLELVNQYVLSALALITEYVTNATSVPPLPVRAMPPPFHTEHQPYYTFAAVLTTDPGYWSLIISFSLVMQDYHANERAHIYRPCMTTTLKRRCFFIFRLFCVNFVFALGLAELHMCWYSYGNGSGVLGIHAAIYRVLFIRSSSELHTIRLLSLLPSSLIKSF
jgi:hypothetical protein